MPVFKNCPYCSEQILSTAKKCKHCGEFMDEEEGHHPKTGYREFTDDVDSFVGCIVKGVLIVIGAFLLLIFVGAPFVRYLRGWEECFFIFC